MKDPKGEGIEIINDGRLIDQEVTIGQTTMQDDPCSDGKLILIDIDIRKEKDGQSEQNGESTDEQKMIGSHNVHQEMLPLPIASLASKEK